MEQRNDNIHLGNGKTRADVIKFCAEREAQLLTPELIIPLLQVNMRAGGNPCDGSGKPMLRAPVNGI